MKAEYLLENSTMEKMRQQKVCGANAFSLDASAPRQVVEYLLHSYLPNFSLFQNYQGALRISAH